MPSGRQKSMKGWQSIRWIKKTKKDTAKRQRNGKSKHTDLLPEASHRRYLLSQNRK